MDDRLPGGLRTFVGRVRTSRRRWPAPGVAVAVTVAAFVAPVVSVGVPEAASDRTAAARCFGAASLERGSQCPQTTGSPTFPSVAEARNDRAPLYEYACQVRAPFAERLTCDFGDRDGTRNVALVGNSHAAHWLPALHEVGLRRGFKVTTYISAMCFATTTRIAWRTEQLRDNCHAWGRWVRRSVAAGDYDLVVQTERTYRWPAKEFTGHSDDVFRRGYRRHLASWAQAGKTVLIIRDTPMPASDVPRCLQRNPKNYGACATSRAHALQRDPLAEAALSFRSARMRVADLTGYFCHGGECPSVVGGVIVHFDASHMTATYARTLAPYLDDHVRSALRMNDGARPGRSAPAAASGI